MKKVFKATLVAAMVLVSVGASAQIGINIGYVNTNRTYSVDGESVTDEMNEVLANPCSGLLIGVAGDLAIQGNLGMSWGLNYTYSFGSKTLAEFMGMSVKIKSNDHYLDVPVRLTYAFPLSDDMKLFAFAGPKFVCALAGSTKGEVSGIELEEGEENESEKHYGKEDEAPFKRFDIKVGGGLGFQYGKYNLKAGYDLGLLNAANTSQDGFKFKSNQFYVTLGLTF